MPLWCSVFTRYPTHSPSINIIKELVFGTRNENRYNPYRDRDRDRLKFFRVSKNPYAKVRLFSEITKKNDKIF